MGAQSFPELVPKVLFQPTPPLGHLWKMLGWQGAESGTAHHAGRGWAGEGMVSGRDGAQTPQA